MRFRSVFQRRRTWVLLLAALATATAAAPAFGVSSTYPGKPFGFVTDFAVCEEAPAAYAGERNAILSSFRP